MNKPLVSGWKKKLLWIVIMLGSLGLAVALVSCEKDDDSSHDWILCTHKAVGTNIQGKLDIGNGYDEVILDFKDHMTSSEVRAWAKAHKLSVVINSDANPQRLFKARVPEGTVPSIRGHFKHSTALERIQENHKMFAYRWKPNDPLYQFQWHFDQIHLEEAWTLSTGHQAIVAVIDTGVAMATSSDKGPKGVKDLQGTPYVEGYDFVDKDTHPWDGSGHGTHVAGTIAQTTNNGYGTSGIAYRAKIMPIRVLNSNGSGSLLDVAKGIYFAADHGAHIINMSLGSSQSSPMLQDAVTYAYNKNVLVVAAAGNSGKRVPGYPAACDHVMAVSATQFDKHPAFYSQWGNYIDIAAPGGNVQVDQNKDGRPDGVLQETVERKQPDNHKFALFMGTSMASPHVAGVAALIVEWGITHPDKVERYLIKGADTSLRQEPNSDDEDKSKTLDKLYPPAEFEERYGAGIIQADKSVSWAIMEPGVVRLLIAFFLSFVLFLVARQENLLQANVQRLAIFVASSVVIGSGLFLLPFIAPFMHIEGVALIVQLISSPLVMWDWFLLGMKTPLLANCIWPALLMFLAYGTDRLKYLTCGISIGCASYFLSEMILMSSFLCFLPNIELVVRGYYFLSATILIIGTYAVLMKDQVLRKDG